ERGQGESVGAKKHFARSVVFAKAHRKRGAAAGANQKVVLALENQCECESALEARQARSHGLDRTDAAAAHGFAHKMGNDFRISFGRKFMALGLQFAAQLAEILDDPIVHDADIRADMRMRVLLARPSMRRPAGVAYADVPIKRFGSKTKFQILELAA